MCVSRMSLDQAYVLCATVTGLEIPYAVFKEHGIDGAALVTMVERDFEQLFSIEHVGLGHRLVHCIRRAAHVPAPELLTTDFVAAEQQLQAWLEGSLEPNRHLLALARFDIITCGDVTANELSMAGIPFAARKPLLMLLQHAQPTTPQASNEASTVVVLEPEVHRAVLEQVLQENKTLAERLRQQQHERDCPQNAVPDEFRCPITREMMHDPVIAEDGQTYEREAIATWVASAGTSPMSRQQMASRFLSNRLVKSMVENWKRGTCTVAGWVEDY
jgi:hypothetical protein